MPLTLTRITDTSEPTLTRLVESYARSFDAREFYPVRVQFAGLPPDEVEAWHRLGIAQKVYRSLRNPGHEVWAAAEAGEVGTGVEGARGGGGDGERTDAETESNTETAQTATGTDPYPALMILKHPSAPHDPPSPFDAALESMPPQAKAKHDTLRARSDALKSAAGEGFHLSWLGTVPAHRRRGLGAALVRMALERARGEGRCLRLSTNSQENVEYYSRFGFTVAGYDGWDMDGERYTWWVMVAE